MNILHLIVHTYMVFYFRLIEEAGSKEKLNNLFKVERIFEALDWYQLVSFTLYMEEVKAVQKSSVLQSLNEIRLHFRNSYITEL